jgi:hypothetical protein
MKNVMMETSLMEMDAAQSALLNRIGFAKVDLPHMRIHAHVRAPQGFTNLETVV